MGLASLGTVPTKLSGLVFCGSALESVMSNILWPGQQDVLVIEVSDRVRDPSQC